MQVFVTLGFVVDYGRNKKLLRNFFDLKMANYKKLSRFTSGLRFLIKSVPWIPILLIKTLLRLSSDVAVKLLLFSPENKLKIISIVFQIPKVVKHPVRGVGFACGVPGFFGCCFISPCGMGNG